ncbi:hypothetical protein D9M68_718370 [compost metagenome]
MLCLAHAGRAQRAQPVVDHGARRNAPLVATLLEAVHVATGDEDLARDALRIAVALQRKEVGLDAGLHACERDRHVGDVVDRALAVLGEFFQGPVDETGSAALVGAVAVGCIRPVSAAQRFFVLAVDAAAVPRHAFADRLAVHQLGDLLVQIWG